ncbi:SEC-C motif-containing protein [Ruminococcaceae bacterium YRB3002]|nr:SEC-C motif-containing protein [Ruminococcaceae bacterium YRB3002]
MTTEQFVSKYSERIERVTDEDILFLRDNREALTPVFLEEIDRLTTIAELQQDYSGSWLGLYSLFFLAEYGEKTAYTKVISLLKLYGDNLDKWIGDISTENMPTILYALFDGDIDKLKELIRDRQIDEYVRAGMISMYVKAWMEGKISDYDADIEIRRLVKDMENDYLKYEVMANVAQEHRIEYLSFFRKVYDDEELEENGEIGLFGEMLDTFYEYDSDPDDVRIPFDIKEELGLWYPVGDETKSRNDREGEEWSSRQRNSIFFDDDPEPGRNDPCPCGSGKKYKNCCLREKEEARRKGVPYESSTEIRRMMFRFPELSFDPLTGEDRSDFVRKEGCIYYEDTLSRNMIMYDYYSTLAMLHTYISSSREIALFRMYMLKAVGYFKDELPNLKFKSMADLDSQFTLHYSIIEVFTIYISIADPSGTRPEVQNLKALLDLNIDSLF